MIVTVRPNRIGRTGFLPLVLLLTTHYSLLTFFWHFSTHFHGASTQLHYHGGRVIRFAWSILRLCYPKTGFCDFSYPLSVQYCTDTN